MKKIKWSISNIAWEKELDNEIYQLLNEKNFDGIEIAPTRIFEKDPYNNLKSAEKYFSDLKKQYSLDISSMQSIWYGKIEKIFESDKDRIILIDYTKKAIDFATVIGCKNLVFGCPKNRCVNNLEDDYNVAIEFFRNLGEYALLNDVVIAIEPNPVIYNTNFLNTTEETIKFVKDVNLKSVKVNYDLGTVIYNNENLATLKENLDYIHHIHISEPNLEVIKKRPIHKELIKILVENNYEKYLSIEMKKSSLEDIICVIDYLTELEEV